jgi:excisionase family DNA binding protein
VVLDLEKELAAALCAPNVIAALGELVRRVVREELERAGMGDDILDVPRAARLLGMTSSAVSKAAWRGTLPCIRIGRRVRFRRSELIAGGRRRP